MNKEIVWNPSNILSSRNNSGGTGHYAVVVLNTKIRWSPKVLLPLWTKASLRFTVDGGTNQWFQWLQENKINFDSIPYPHFVTGDMDSIHVRYLEIVRDFHSTSIIVTDDQNETDFTKALKEIHSYTERHKQQLENVIAVVDTSGRLDQIMANINTLFKARTILPNVCVYQLSSDSVSWLISPGRHKIYIPEKLRENKTWCALIPIGEPCRHVSTTGLKWDLNDRSVKFGELVSTSNTYSDMPYVTIETEKTILWSMGLDGLYSNNDHS